MYKINSVMSRREKMTHTSIFEVEIYMSAMLICVTGILFTLINQRTDKLQNKIYLALISVLSLNCIFEIISALTRPYNLTSEAAAIATKLSTFLYFLLHSALAPLFFLYVLIVCGVDIKRYILSGVPFVAGELLVLVTPFTSAVYYFDSSMVFHRNWAESVVYVSSGLYLTMAIFMLMSSWRALNSKRRTALIYLFIVIILGLTLQLIDFNIRSELVSEAVALIGVMISIEIEDDRIDAGMGIYNRHAFTYDINTYILSGRKLCLLCLKITNTEIIKRATGSDNTDASNKMVAEYLKTLVPRYLIYSTNPDTFMITLMDNDEQKAVALAETISKRFESPWEIGENEIPLRVLLMAAEVPDRISTVTDALYMADSPVPKKIDKDILTGSDLDYLLRRAAVESAVTRGLAQNNFEVFYQPTYYVGDGRLHGAEALIRLRDPELGNLFPEEFIPIAEQIGLIDEVDDFVLRQVCSFIKSGVPAEGGMEYINVNLSVLECMQPDFAEHVIGIVDEYGIEKSMINFEITESIAASDYVMLSRVVRILKRQGFRFSMDDYGTGYSNMQSIFRLDFDIVKIDKSILWSAEKGHLGQIILESSVRMIRQMRRKILVEGVETEHQLQMLRDLEIDYAQGFFFSKPISLNDFIALIKKQ